MAAAAVGLHRAIGLHRGNNVCGGRGEAGPDMNKAPRPTAWVGGGWRDFKFPTHRLRALPEIPAILVSGRQYNVFVFRRGSQSGLCALV